jgi:hypothetical protein
MQPCHGRSLTAIATTALVLAACGGLGEDEQAPPQPPPRAPTLAGPEIGELRVLSTSAFAATIAWRTGAPARGLVGVGPPQGDPLVWWAARGPAVRHAVRITGLAPATPYRVSVTSVAQDEERAAAAIELGTAGLPRAPSAVAEGGAMRVEGSPFFPVFSWGDCSDDYETSLAAGVNVFAANRCGGLGAQLEALGGRALSAELVGEHGVHDGLVGAFYPDEADGLGFTATSLPHQPAGEGLRFLTLTNHFYSGAAPLPQGRRMYPGLIAKADMVGFDLYPLQIWCRPERLADVYLAQRELVRLAGDRPTFQWIEAAGMECPDGPTAVTPATVRAESWLAVAGGARGLGYFPPAAWTGDVGAAIAEITAAVRYLGPALVAREAPVRAETGAPVMVGARTLNGALYLVAVNSSFAAARATITSPGLDGRPLTVVGEKRRVQPDGDSLTETFGPLAARVYVAEPASGR